MKQLVLKGFIILISLSSANAQDKRAYQLFKSNGKAAKYDKMIKDLAESDMVFFLEYQIIQFLIGSN
ncbi:MAG: hypothetical protein ABI263_09560 [Gelidibacter sp.]